MKYSEKLKDPRWQKKRLEIFERDEWMCQRCQDSESTLAVHHRYYESGNEPWDYPNEALVTLCENCHEEEYNSRPKEEGYLLKEFRRLGFWASDLSNILIAFHEMKMIFPPEIMVDIITWSITNKEMMQETTDKYWAHLKKRNDTDYGKS